jgi:hypothetical protein
MRGLIAFISFLALVVLFLYPIAYVTFPWTVPVPYLLTCLVAMTTFAASILR